MYMEEFMAAANAAKAKSTLLKENGAGYMASAMLAGAYIGFGILLIFTIGGLLNGQPYAKIVMGLSFGIALSLVVIAGAELFTGNNLVMAAGFFKCGNFRFHIRHIIFLHLFFPVGGIVDSP